MSKHFIKQTSVNGVELVLECGYDRPTESFFANISSEGDVYYTSLAETGPKDSGWLLTVTAKHGLVLPQKMMESLAMEAMFGGSNAVTEHDAYTQTESDKHLLLLGFRQQMPSMLPVDNPVWVWYTDNDEGLGQYALLQSKGYQAYVPSLLCDVLPQGLDWPVPDEQDLLKHLEVMQVRLLKGAYQEHPGESVNAVLHRILGFVPAILTLESKLHVLFSEEEFENERQGFWEGDCWGAFTTAKVYEQCDEPAKDGEHFISVSKAYDLLRGELVKIQTSGVKSISDDDLCASCGHCNYCPGDMSSCSKGWPGYQDKDGYVKVCFASDVAV
ncbi:hypothetical protein [Comamonas testosteroni]|uniref:Uncharacterized protein n=1 Tax=Comamonas testosteroni TaxID=285 RepID=A0A096FM20_COMTE|nr:hypothetical protein [Comamonas testosteroni]KGH30823.1 hypothetical protein P353_08155 [Comamonas testosteroni]WKL18746.1 hypothetical protein QYQ99_27480 [Comamonas testosteroni]